MPVFPAGDLPRLERACAGRSFQQRRYAAVIAAFRARPEYVCRSLRAFATTPDDPRCNDIDLWHWEITVHGKGRKTRTVKIGHDAARSPDRYLRVRARHAQAFRPQLWLGGRQPKSADR